MSQIQIDPIEAYRQRLSAALANGSTQPTVQQGSDAGAGLLLGAPSSTPQRAEAPEIDTGDRTPLAGAGAFATSGRTEPPAAPESYHGVTFPPVLQGASNELKQAYISQHHPEAVQGLEVPQEPTGIEAAGLGAAQALAPVIGALGPKGAELAASAQARPPAPGLAGLAGSFAGSVLAYSNPVTAAMEITGRAAKAADDARKRGENPAVAIGRAGLSAGTDLGILRLAAGQGPAIYKNVEDALIRGDGKAALEALGRTTGTAAGGAAIEVGALGGEKAIDLSAGEKPVKQAWDEFLAQAPQAAQAGAVTGVAIGVDAAILAGLRANATKGALIQARQALQSKLDNATGALKSGLNPITNEPIGPVEQKVVAKIIQETERGLASVNERLGTATSLTPKDVAAQEQDIQGFRERLTSEIVQSPPDLGSQVSPPTPQPLAPVSPPESPQRPQGPAVEGLIPPSDEIQQAPQEQAQPAATAIESASPDLIPGVPPNAIREPSTTSVLQREPVETGISGGERGRVESGQQGAQPAEAVQQPAQAQETQGGVQRGDEGVKQLWEMTREDVVREGYHQTGKVTDLALQRQVNEWQKRVDEMPESEGAARGLERAQRRWSLANEHRMAVEQALAAGKPVPPEVLADYPDLAKQAIVTDASERQRLKNSIAEGELILKTGKFNGRKKSAAQLEAVQRAVEKAKARLGPEPADATIAQRGSAQQATIETQAGLAQEADRGKQTRPKAAKPVRAEGERRITKAALERSTLKVGESMPMSALDAANEIIRNAGSREYQQETMRDQPNLSVDSFAVEPDTFSQYGKAAKMRAAKMGISVVEDASDVRELLGDKLYEQALEEAFGGKAGRLRIIADNVLSSPEYFSPQDVLNAFVLKNWNAGVSLEEARSVYRPHLDPASLKAGDSFSIMGEPFEVVQDGGKLQLASDAIDSRLPLEGIKDLPIDPDSLEKASTSQVKSDLFGKPFVEKATGEQGGLPFAEESKLSKDTKAINAKPDAEGQQQFSAPITSAIGKAGADNPPAGPASAMGAASAVELATPQGKASRYAEVIRSIFENLRVGTKQRLATWAGRAAPKTSVESEASGNALVRYASASMAGKPTAASMSAQVLGDQYKNPAFADYFGAVLVEGRLRAVRQGLLDEAESTEDPDLRGDLEKQAARVGSLVGTDAFKTEKDFQDALNDPQVVAARDRHNSIVQPFAREMHEQLGGRLAGEDESGSFVNLIALGPNDPGYPKSYRTGQGNLSNPRKRKSVHNLRASGTAAAYNIHYPDLVENAISENMKRVALRAMYDQLVADDLAVVAREGERFEDPAGNTSSVPYIRGKPGIMLKGIEDIVRPMFNDKGYAGGRIERKQIWLYPAIAGEVRNALNVDSGFGTIGIAKVLHAATIVQIAGPTDFLFHSVNILSSIAASPGGKTWLRELARRFPGVNILDSVLRVTQAAYDVYQDSPQVRERIAELATIGSGREAHKAAIPGKLLQIIDRAGRLVRDRMFQTLVDRGLAKDTEANRRDFINKMGQYNARLMPRVDRTLKEIGLSPFIVAGKTFNRLAVGSMAPTAGIETTGRSAWAKIVAAKLGGLALALAIPAILNLLTQGNPLGRDGVPIGAIDIGGKDRDGNPRYIDPLKWILVRRGLRITGIGRILEGLRTHQDAASMIDAALMDIYRGIIHPYAGPAADALAVLVTGHNTGLFKEAPTAAPDQSQMASNALQALKDVNPTVGAAFRGGEQQGLLGAVTNPITSLGGALGVGSKKPTSPEAIHGARLSDWLDQVASETRKIPVSQRTAFVKQRLMALQPDERVDAAKNLARRGVFTDYSSDFKQTRRRLSESLDAQRAKGGPLTADVKETALQLVKLNKAKAAIDAVKRHIDAGRMDPEDGQRFIDEMIEYAMGRRDAVPAAPRFLSPVK